MIRVDRNTVYYTLDPILSSQLRQADHSLPVADNLIAEAGLIQNTEWYVTKVQSQSICSLYKWADNAFGFAEQRTCDHFDLFLSEKQETSTQCWRNVWSASWTAAQHCVVFAGLLTAHIPNPSSAEISLYKPRRLKGFF